MTWRDDMASADFLAAVASTSRMVSSRVELVDVLGNPAGDMSVDAATVDFKGEASQQWAGSLTISDPSLVPTSQDSPLDPRARLRVRLWWRLRKPDLVNWWEIPVGTMRTPSPGSAGDIDITAGRSGIGMTVPLVDVLAESAGNSGYRGGTIQLGGANVGDALTTLFGYLVPGVPVEIGTTSVTLPNPFEVGGSDSRTAQQDWTEIAAAAGWVVRSTREGAISCGPAVEPDAPALDWQEGPTCAVTELGRGINYAAMTNYVECRSTSPEVNPPVVGVAQDSDPGSSTYTGRLMWPTYIRSDVVTTAEAATNMAAATYGRYRRPLETVRVTIPSRPDLDYRQPARIARASAGVAGDYAVSSWNLRMAAKPQRMTVTMMQRAIQ